MPSVPITTNVVNSLSWRVVFDTTLCDTICERLSAGRWFSPATPVSFTNKTDRHDITEILLKVVLNTIILTHPYFYINCRPLSKYTYHGFV